jgi:hypothetical protein
MRPATVTILLALCTAAIGQTLSPLAVVASAAEKQPAPGTAKTGVWTNVTPSGLNLSPTYDRSGNYGVNDVLADPARPSDFYAFVNYQGVWKSTDFGATWTKISAKGGPLDLGRAWGEAIDKNPKRDPATPPRMYACQGYGPVRGVWVSTNGGADWTRYSNGGANDDVYNFDTDPNDVMHVISVDHADNHCYESTDGGVTWKDKGEIRAGDATATHSAYLWFLTADTWLSISEADHGDGHGTFRTTDRGATWTRVLKAEHAHGACQAFIEGDTIYLPHTRGIHKSADRGATWTQVSTLRASSVVATSKHLYASYGFPLLSHHFDPALQRAARATGTLWSADYTPRPPAMINGTKRAAVSFDGKHYVVVSGNWCEAGIWRYVEP